MMNKKEFEESLIEPIIFWDSKTKEGVGDLLGEQVSMVVGYNQHNPRHCYDLFQHSLHTVESISAIASVELRVAAFFMI